MLETSWTGSETQRREQGNCPASPIDSTASIPPWERERAKPDRWELPAGTPILVRKLEDGPKKWQPHRTREALQFATAEHIAAGKMVFRHLGYIISVSARHVIRLDGGVARSRR